MLPTSNLRGVFVGRVMRAVVSVVSSFNKSRVNVLSSAFLLPLQILRRRRSAGFKSHKVMLKFHSCPRYCLNSQSYIMVPTKSKIDANSMIVRKQELQIA